MRYEHEDVGDRRAAEERGLPPRRVTLALLIFYVCGGLLNGEHLLEKAELMPFGRTQDIAVALARPVATASRLTRLNVPRQWIESR